jgi:hypothetical protein
MGVSAHLTCRLDHRRNLTGREMRTGTPVLIVRFPTLAPVSTNFQQISVWRTVFSAPEIQYFRHLSLRVFQLFISFVESNYRIIPPTSPVLWGHM